MRPADTWKDYELLDATDAVSYTHLIPWDSINLMKPRLDMTVTTAVLPSKRPFSRCV